MPDYAWHWSGYALAILASLFILWSLFADRARGRKRCRKCWYDLASLGEVPTTCPECGKAHAKPKHLIRTRRRYRRAIIGLVFLIASYGLWTTPRVIAGGWYGAVPTTGLVLTAPWLNYKWMSSGNHTHEIMDEFKIRLIEDEERVGLWLAGTFWSLMRVDDIWPMTDRDIEDIQARNQDTVANYHFQSVLSRGYGLKRDQIKYVIKNVLDGKCISLLGTPLFSADQEPVGIRIDSISKDPSARHLVIYFDVAQSHRQAAKKPTTPYTQSVLTRGGNREWKETPGVTVWANGEVLGPTLFWIESARGADLGAYQVEWRFDTDFLSSDSFIAFLDLAQWRAVKD